MPTEPIFECSVVDCGDCANLPFPEHRRHPTAPDLINPNNIEMNTRTDDTQGGDTHGNADQTHEEPLHLAPPTSDLLQQAYDRYIEYRAREVAASNRIQELRSNGKKPSTGEYATILSDLEAHPSQWSSVLNGTDFRESEVATLGAFFSFLETILDSEKIELVRSSWATFASAAVFSCYENEPVAVRVLKNKKSNDATGGFMEEMQFLKNPAVFPGRPVTLIQKGYPCNLYALRPGEVTLVMLHLPRLMSQKVNLCTCTYEGLFQTPQFVSAIRSAKTWAERRDVIELHAHSLSDSDRDNFIRSNVHNKHYQDQSGPGVMEGKILEIIHRLDTTEEDVSTKKVLLNSLRTLNPSLAQPPVSDDEVSQCIKSVEQIPTPDDIAGAKSVIQSIESQIPILRRSEMKRAADDETLFQRVTPSFCESVVRSVEYHLSNIRRIEMHRAADETLFQRVFPPSERGKLKCIFGDQVKSITYEEFLTSKIDLSAAFTLPAHLKTQALHSLKKVEAMKSKYERKTYWAKAQTRTYAGQTSLPHNETVALISPNHIVGIVVDPNSLGNASRFLEAAELREDNPDGLRYPLALFTYTAEGGLKPYDRTVRKAAAVRRPAIQFPNALPFAAAAVAGAGAAAAVAAPLPPVPVAPAIPGPVAPPVIPGPMAPVIAGPGCWASLSSCGKISVCAVAGGTTAAVAGGVAALIAVFVARAKAEANRLKQIVHVLNGDDITVGMMEKSPDRWVRVTLVDSDNKSSSVVIFTEKAFTMPWGKRCTSRTITPLWQEADRYVIGEPKGYMLIRNEPNMAISEEKIDANPDQFSRAPRLFRTESSKFYAPN